MDEILKKKGQVILFDMDGTLLDTEKYYRICWPAACAAFGLTMTDEQALAIRSLGRPYAVENFHRMFGPDADYYAVREKRKELMSRMLLEKGLQAKPKAAQALALLKEMGCRLAVTTASDEGRTEEYLSQTGLLPFFDDLICATMVEKGKPAPDIYLYACGRMGAAPSEVFAVEDAPNGILSAKRAGCHVVMIPDQSGPEEELLGQLDAVCPDLLEFAHFIKAKR